MIRSSWPSLVPYPRSPFGQHLAEAARRLPDKPALIEGDGTTSTFRELWDASNSVARLLQREANLKKGDIVAITAEGTREFMAAMYGALLAGGTVTPLNPGLRGDEAATQLADSGASLAFASIPLRLALERLAASGGLPGLRSIWPLEEVWAMARTQPGLPEPVGIDLDADLAMLCYTAGTAGRPKGAMHTHANATASTCQLAATGRMTESSVVLNLLPPWRNRMAFAVGATCVQATLAEPDRTWWLIERCRVSHIIVRPFSLQTLLRAYERAPWDASSVQLVESSGTSLPPGIAEDAARIFGCPIVQAYHLMETMGSANRTPLHESNPRSVGCPVCDTEEMIVDPESGAEVAESEEGELLIRGPQVTRGYWRQPEATTAAFLPGGWMRTGDIARLGPDGHVYIVDRAKELIKVYGRQVAPAEVEAVLLEHPAVQEAAVIPIPSSDAGEVPKAFVVVGEGQQVTAEELMGLVARRLASFKAVHEVQFVASLPRGAGGKILRRLLVERERSSTPPAQ